MPVQSSSSSSIRTSSKHHGQSEIALLTSSRRTLCDMDSTARSPEGVFPFRLFFQVRSEEGPRLQHNRSESPSSEARPSRRRFFGKSHP